MTAAAQIEFAPEQARRNRITAFDFLCACCRCPAGEPELTAALNSASDWGPGLALASSHRVLPAVYAALRERKEVPASIQSALEARFSAHSRRVLRFSAMLSAILRQFAAAKIEVILHKGPGLAKHLYGDAAMREFGDLDLLVHAKDVPRARAALRELGFRPQLELTARQERAYLRAGYEYVFASGLGANVVELQWQIVPRFYAVAFQPEELFRRSIVVEFEGEPARTLCDEDLLLTLCAHAAKHCWSQLGMVRDIAALSARPLDWPWITNEARRLGILRILAVSLVLARNLMGIELSLEAATGAGFDECEVIAAVVEDNMRNNLDPDTESLDYFRFMMQLRENWQDRARFAARLVFTPSVGEWNAIQMPDVLFPLYRGVRMLRLLKRAF